MFPVLEYAKYFVTFTNSVHSHYKIKGCVRLMPYLISSEKSVEGFNKMFTRGSCIMSLRDFVQLRQKKISAVYYNRWAAIPLVVFGFRG
jgi:hypothetical protein